MVTSAAWILNGLLFLVLVSLYRRGVRERNNLAVYAGMLLLSEKAREDTKKDFEDWLRRSAAPNALSLSTAAVLAIQGSANRVASRGASLSFNTMVWNHKKELETAQA